MPQGEIVGEVVIPSQLVIPTNTTATRTGDIFISGGKLYFYSGSGVELITST